VTQEPEGLARQTPGPWASGRRGRWLPPWARRRPAIAAVAAAVLLAVVVPIAVLGLPRSSAPPAYTSLPGQPCALVSSAELARYLPGATGTPQNLGPSTRTVKIGGCKWVNTSGGEDRTLVAEAIIFGSADAIGAARQSYRDTLARLGCRCQGVTASTRAMAGLGDQAAEVSVTVAPDADPASAPNLTDPGNSLLVRSGNAVVLIALNTTGTASGAPLTPPPDTAQLAGMVSMARGALGVLARPASVPVTAIGPVAPEPRYTGQRDPCRLISTATLARYAPGANMNLDPHAGSGASWQSASCIWGSDSTPITLYLSLYRDAASARQAAQGGGEGFGQSGNGVTVTGSQWLPNLGDGAAVTFRTDGLDLVVWSGNAELDYLYGVRDSAASRPRAVLLAGAIAMARDGLAALARPAASAYPRGPVYARPGHPCRLVRTSTLARYAPGATAGTVSAGGEEGTSECAWNAPAGDLFLSVSIYPNLDSAEGGFVAYLRYAPTAPDTTFHGKQPVTGLGQRAAAVFTTEDQDSPEVDVYAWSGNVVVKMSFVDDTLAGPPLSQAGKLAADIAMARDVLASLKRA
jgi:hypothetical protein